ncbi:MAG TPA: response regulator transcription factor [Anaerolineae bacterium]
MPGFLYLQIRAYWLQNRLAEANSVLTRLGDPATSHLFTAVDQVATYLARGLLAQSTKRYPEAESEFLTAVELHRRVRHTVRLTYPRLSLATLYYQWGRGDQALAEMTVALADIRQQGKPGIVLQEGHSIVPLLELALEQGVEREMVQSLLATFNQSAATHSIAVPGTNETLTPRQVEVLQLIAAGASNQEIAEQLVISKWTVKSHVTKILAKLSVSSRTQAAARARELDLHPA